MEEHNSHRLRITILVPDPEDAEKEVPAAIMNADECEAAPFLSAGDEIALDGLPNARVVRRTYFTRCGHLVVEAGMSIIALPEPDTLEVGAAEAALVEEVKRSTGKARREAFRDLVAMRAEAVARSMGAE